MDLYSRLLVQFIYAIKRVYRRIETFVFSTAMHTITETLSRTLITSGTTLLVVLALFLLGGEIIHDFAFALLVGVLIGTYSSIYVASPVAVFLTKLAPPAGTAPATT